MVASFEERTKAASGWVGLAWDDFIDLLTGELEAIYKAGAKSAAKDLGTGPFKQLNVAARDYARDRAAELVGKKWVGGKLVDNPNAKWTITEPTRDRLRALVEEALDDGMTPDELRRAILESPDFSQARAKVIADTELANAQSQGSLAEWKESGVVAKKIWLLSGNHAVPDDCDLNADAGEVPIDEPFPSGHMTAGAHPGCTCDVAAIAS